MRPFGLLFALLLFVLPAAPLAQPGVQGPAGEAPPAPPVWPVTGGGPLRQGFTPLRLPETNKVLWRIELPGAGIFGSSPVVDGQHRIYTVTNDTLTSTPQSVLWCLDRGGSVLWSLQLSDEFEFQPVLLSTGRLLLFSLSKQLYAFDSTGALLWRRQYSASPRVGDREVWANYTAGLETPTHVQPLPDREGNLLVVDDSPSMLSVDGTGKLRWQVELYGSCAGGLLLINGLIYTPACDGRLHVYSAATGAEQPTLAIGGLAPSHPTGLPGAGVYCPVGNVIGERLLLLPFAGTKGFEARLGQQIRTPLSINAASECVIGIGAAGTVDGGIQTEGQLVGISSSSGKLLWSRDFNALPAGAVLADPTGRYCFGTQDLGTPGVYTLDAEHGVQWWLNVRGASVVFPIDDRLLGVQVTSERPEADKNKMELLAIGA